MDGMRMIMVRPRHPRKIILRALNEVTGARLVINGAHYADLTESGLITRAGLRTVRDLELRTETGTVLSFHDHPNEMGISEEYRELAERLAEAGDLVIEE